MNEEVKTVIKPNTEDYKKSRTATGNTSQICGDAVSLALEGLHINEVKEVARRLGFEEVNKYDHLNVGQQRMNLGNRIRGIVNTMEGQMEKDEDGDLVNVGEGIGFEALANAAKPFADAARARAEEAERVRQEKKAEAEKRKAEKEAKKAAAAQSQKDETEEEAA